MQAASRRENVGTPSLPLFLGVYESLKEDPESRQAARWVLRIGAFINEYLLALFLFSNFRRCYAFESAGVFHNPARANADHAHAQKDPNSIAGRLVQAGSGSNIYAPCLLFMSNGIVAACNLVNPGKNGSGNYSHNIKKIGIWVLMEEFEAMMSYFGHLYNRKVFVAQYFADAIYFQTQKEGGGPTRSGKCLSYYYLYRRIDPWTHIQAPLLALSPPQNPPPVKFLVNALHPRPLLLIIARKLLPSPRIFDTAKKVCCLCS